jgi:hypothetical protein
MPIREQRLLDAAYCAKKNAPLRHWLWRAFTEAGSPFVSYEKCSLRRSGK